MVAVHRFGLPIALILQCSGMYHEVSGMRIESREPDIDMRRGELGLNSPNMNLCATAMAEISVQKSQLLRHSLVAAFSNSDGRRLQAFHVRRVCLFAY